MLKQPLTLEQPVYLPGNEHDGVWASSLLETVVRPEPKWAPEAAIAGIDRPKLHGDLELALFAAGEVRRAYAEFQATDATSQTVRNSDRRAETSPVASDRQLAQRSR
jgi:hypothetical protein